MTASCRRSSSSSAGGGGGDSSDAAEKAQYLKDANTCYQSAVNKGGTIEGFTRSDVEVDPRA